ncbi:MAG: L-glutamate gamma-semialdehyde dehydrogenase [Vicinamibacterales bacterium]
MSQPTPPAVPVNEPNPGYLPGSPERGALKAELARMAADRIDIPPVIGGASRMTASRTTVVMPHHHGHVLGDVALAANADVQRAIDAALAARRDWAARSPEERAAVFLRAADLLASSWRPVINAATMLGQSKTVFQAEVDAAAELVDFWRFNVHFARELEAEQPISTPVAANRLDYRGLEGFVYAITPFNFTSIAGNLPTAPALMGNVVVWKPAATSMLAAHHLMRLLMEAGLPAGVINMVAGDAAAVTEVVLASPHLAGVHFTGSTEVFDGIWARIGRDLGRYRAYPRLVGETGGKDFVVAHASAEPQALAVALARGAFEYQGQKCSASSRAYVPQSMWPDVRDRLVAMMRDMRVGDPSDFRTFMGAVIDQRAFSRITGYIDDARQHARIIQGGSARSDVGYFVDPTLVETDNPGYRLMREEIFGPVLTVYPYPDGEWAQTLDLVNGTSPYALTGAVFAQDPEAVREAMATLRDAAGNFYVNDKPTGAVVGQQPFGGARRSGTNDKAGSKLNLIRWVSPRTIKTTHQPPTDWQYPYMSEA